MTAEPTETLIGRIAQPWCAVAFDDLPPEVVDVGRHCLLDWLGCTLAGSREPLSLILRGELADGACTVVGTGRTASAATAALVNGASGHALDYDDTHLLLPGHPSAPILPAALAVAQELGQSGPELVSAFVVGVEVACRVGAVLAPRHYQAGWHATGTVGTFGAAAAVAHLLGLDPGRTAHALALAGTQAAGLQVSFGTMAKPLHAGRAASNGVLAARLASRGFTGNPALLEATHGFGAAAGGAAPNPEQLDRLDDRWTIRDTLFKYHAACYLSHASINAALALAGKVPVEDIERVEVHVAEGSLQVCNIAEPATGLEGKFSLRAVTAMALLGDDTTDMAAFSDDRMIDTGLIALRDRVHVVGDADLVPTQSKVVLVARDGMRFAATDDTGRPADDLTLQGERLRTKFRGLANPVIGQVRTQQLLEAVVGLAPAGTIAQLAVA